VRVTGTDALVRPPTEPGHRGRSRWHGRLRRWGAGRRWTALALVGLVAALLGAGWWLAGHDRTAVTEPAPTGGQLSWAPPVLIDPLTVTVTAQQRSLKLRPDRDYRVVLPQQATDLGGGVTITGGHHVVVVGGTISVPDRSQVPDAKQRRGLYLKDQTGTVHVEGVRLTGDLSDGINLDERRGAVVQLENVQVDRVHGSRDGHHADVVQTWAGPRELLVDGLRATTEYQGLFLLPTQQWPAGPDPQHVVVRRSVITMAAGAAYAVWLPEIDPPWWDAAGLTVRRSPGDDRVLVWPKGSTPPRSVGAGQPTGQLPGGVPGAGYRSPGYVEQAGELR
jgi:hypothetical protein